MKTPPRSDARPASTRRWLPARPSAATCCWLPALLPLLALPAPALAADLLVPSEYATIQAAIDAAAAGDRVRVAPGLYAENLDFSGKPVVVESEAGPESTTIDGGGRGPVARFVSGEGRDSALVGFTLRGGSVGVRIQGASPVVRGSDVLDSVGVGVSVSAGAPLLEDLQVAGGGDTGVVLESSSAELTASWIGANRGTTGGGLRVLRSSGAVISGNTLEGNQASAGGGIAFVDSGAPFVERNRILDNRSTSGGGVSITGSSEPTLAGNLIAGNESLGGGGGIAWRIPSFRRGPRLVGNTIADNLSNTGSGILVDGSSERVELVNNVIVASPGQAAMRCFGPGPVMRANDVLAPGGIPYFLCPDPTGVDGNVQVDPRFVDPAAGDYRLRPDSPLLDAGDDAAAALLATDLDGDPRIVDGDGDSVARVDIGADELSQTALTLDPALAFLQPGDGHRLEATLSRGASPAVGETLRLDIVSGPNAGRTAACEPADCTTDADGVTRFAYRGSGVGVDEIVARVDASDGLASKPVLAFWDADCNQNGVPDTCDVSCDGFDGACQTYACGTSADADGDGAPDECNAPPVADAGPDRSLECFGPRGTAVALDGSGSSDPDGDPLSYRWDVGGVMASGVTVAPVLPLGTSEVRLRVSDGRGGEAEDRAAVEILDTRPPQVEASFEPTRGGAKVHFSCSDVCDAAPTAEATLDGAPVADGAEVAMRSLRRRHWRHDDDDDGGRRRWRRAPMTLEVVCRDASGNEARATAEQRVKRPRRRWHDDDDD